MTDTTAPRTAAGETATCAIRVSLELMDILATRDIQGNRLYVDWGDPDEAGFYTPTIRADFTDNVAAEARAEAIEPLLALVRAAQERERAEEAWADANEAYNTSHRPGEIRESLGLDRLDTERAEAILAVRERLRALPAEVIAAARRP